MQHDYLRHVVRDCYQRTAASGPPDRRLEIGRQWSSRRRAVFTLASLGIVFGVLAGRGIFSADSVPVLIIVACLLLFSGALLVIATRIGLTHHQIEIEAESIRIVRKWLFASVRAVASNALRRTEAIPRPWTLFERLASPLAQSAGREQPHTVVLCLADGSRFDANLSLTPDDAQQLARDLEAAVGRSRGA